MDDKGNSFPYPQAHNKLIENAYSKDCDSIDLALTNTEARIIFFPGKVNQGQMGIQVDKDSDSVINVYREEKERHFSMFVSGTCAAYLDNGRRELEELITEVRYPAN